MLASVIRERESMWWEVGGVLFRILQDSRARAGQFGLAELRGLRGCKAPPHIHTREIDESFIVTKGQLTMHVEEEEYVLHEGDQIVLPKDIMHWFEITGLLAHWTAVYTPGGYEHFFEEVGHPYSGLVLPNPYPPDKELLKEKAIKYGVFYL